LATTIGVDIVPETILLTSASDGSMGNDLYTVAGRRSGQAQHRPM